MKLWCYLLMVGLALTMLIGATVAERDRWGLEEEEETEREVLVRTARGTKERNKQANGGANGAPACRYTKGQWSECNTKTNTRTRVLTLKKGDKTCEQTKSVTKKCKKACRYEKGSWGSCVNDYMARVDSLKANSDSSCEQTRRMSKKCKPEASAKKAAKNRSNKKASKQQ